MNDISKAISHAYLNRPEILQSTECGCFYCGAHLSKDELLWTDCNDPDEEEPGAVRKDRGETAVCPHCNNASVIGSASGFPITEELLKEANEYWFKSGRG